MEYPEHMKLEKISDKSQTCGVFLDWLREKYIIASYQDSPISSDQELFPVYIETRKLLAEFFEIDEDRLEKEKDEMLKEIRKSNEKVHETSPHHQGATVRMPVSHLEC